MSSIVGQCLDIVNSWRALRFAPIFLMVASCYSYPWLTGSAPSERVFSTRFSASLEQYWSWKSSVHSQFAVTTACGTDFLECSLLGYVSAAVCFTTNELEDAWLAGATAAYDSQWIGSVSASHWLRLIVHRSKPATGTPSWSQTCGPARCGFARRNYRVSRSRSHRKVSKCNSLPRWVRLSGRESRG